MLLLPHNKNTWVSWQMTSERNRIVCEVFLLADVLGGLWEQQGHFKYAYELVNMGARKSSPVNRLYIFQCMGKTFCVEFQRVPLKFIIKCLTHTLKDTISYNVKDLRDLISTSSYASLRSPGWVCSHKGGALHGHGFHRKTPAKIPVVWYKLSDMIPGESEAKFENLSYLK